MGVGGHTEWEPIRGAPNEVVRFERTYPFEWTAFSLLLALGGQGVNLDYCIKVGVNQNSMEGYRVFGEELKAESGSIFATVGNSESTPFQISLSDGRKFPFENSEFKLGSDRPVLSQLYRPGLVPPPFPVPVPDVPSVLANTRFLELSSKRMRESSVPGATSLGDTGQNLPSALESICDDADRKQTLLSWFEELTPMEVTGFEFPRDPSGRIHLQIVEHNGRKVSVSSVSDGTLRFLAMLSLLLNDDAGGIYFFEDIDSGIHPSRLRLLMELIETRTAKGKIQVVTTTHSPALLAWMNDETFENTSVVYRDEHWRDSVIRPIADLYNLRELRKSKGLEWLLTSDWLDNALHFSEGGSDTEDGEGGAEE